MELMRRGPHGGPRGKAAKAQDFWGTTGRLVSYLRPWAWGMIASIILAIISVVLSIISPKILGQATTTIYEGMMKGYAQMKAGHHLSALPIDFDK
ncbi:MAG: ABC transporter ATP-binding protein, partial [Limosilactobacillus mucosae]